MNPKPKSREAEDIGARTSVADPRSTPNLQGLDLHNMSDRKVGEPVGSCPLTECAVTALVCDDEKAPIEGAKVTVDTVGGTHITDKNGFVHVAGIRPPEQRYRVRVDLDAKASDYFWSGSDQPTTSEEKDIGKGVDKFYLFQAQRKGTLKVDVVHIEPDKSEVAEPAVQVKATGATMAKVIGPVAWAGNKTTVFPDTYELEAVLDATQLKKFRVPAKQSVVVGIGQDKQDTLKLELNVRTLIVDVVRRDRTQKVESSKMEQENKPLSAPAVVKIKGPAPATTETSATTAWDDTDKVDRAIFKMPDEGDYDVTIEPKKDEVDFKTTPDPAKLQAKVPRDGEAKVQFILTPFKEIQFVAFELNVLPKKTVKSGVVKKEVYLGSDDAAKDIEKRCTIMKAAIKAAHAHGSVDQSSKVLKVFMAPEFYFRNTDGAYPIEKVSGIMEELRKETNNAKYKDWLFVFGTAIGYLRHEQLDKKGKPGKRPSGLRHEVQITSVSKGGGETKMVVKGDACGQVNLEVPWNLAQDPYDDPIIACKDLGGGLFEVKIKDEKDYSMDNAELVEPITTEVFNLALVQRGGPDNRSSGDKSLREAIVYKEYVSHMDFIRDKSRNWEKPEEHQVTIHSTTGRTIIPTQGSSAPLGGVGEKNESEVTQTGLGGGSVFTVDGITFGLEICLDHAKKKLKEFYDNSAAAGDPKVQVHLIPSCGMSIGGGPIVCTPATGLVFNVDGNPPGTSSARINDGKWSCDDHPARTDAAAGDCPQCGKYMCFNGHRYTGPLKCGTCSAPMALVTGSFGAPMDLRKCPNNHYWWWGTTCSVCGGKLTKINAQPASVYYYACGNSHASPYAGKCGCGEDVFYNPSELIQMGSPLAEAGAQAQVELSGLDWLKTTQKHYFNEKGRVRVYVKKPVPDPADV